MVSVFEGAVGAIVMAVAMCVMTIGSSLHQVYEGHVGVYYRGGALLDAVSGAGYHVMLPYITHMRMVQTTMQTDEVTNVPCGTSGGVMITFDRIEVVNQLTPEAVHSTVKQYTTDYDKPLIFNKVHHELNQFCSSHTLQEVYIDKFDQLDEGLMIALQKDLTDLAPGLKILGVRVTKPRIPGSIREGYERMEAEKTTLMVRKQQQKVVEMEAETVRRRMVIEAEREAEVARIHNTQQVDGRKSAQEIQRISDQMLVDQMKAKTDAAFYAQQKEAEGNLLRLTPAYLEYVRVTSLANNSKVYFGPSIPSMLFTSDVATPQVPAAAAAAAAGHDGS